MSRLPFKTLRVIGIFLALSNFISAFSCPCELFQTFPWLFGKAAHKQSMKMVMCTKQYV